ncbi:MAG: hypothetical protein AAF696_39525, partial [Bacteroidota bacterium]
RYIPDARYFHRGESIEVENLDPEEENIRFEFNRKTVKVSSKGKERVFKRKLFWRLRGQMQEIESYWRTEFCDKERKEIRNPPKLKEGQIAVMALEQRTGIVLTTMFNRYRGWGKTYLIFDKLEAAHTYVEQQLNMEHGFVLYDHHMNFIEEIPNPIPS